MLYAMQEANLEPPNFNDRRASFQVTFRNHTLMNPDAIAWLNHFANFTLTDRQRLALVYLRQHERITNNEYRRLNRVDTMMAGQELRGLVETGLLETQGVGRWTSYQLKVSPQVSEEQESQTDEEQILAYVRQRGSINNSECRDLLQVDLHRASHLLKKMHAYGLLRREGERRWARYHLP